MSYVLITPMRNEAQYIEATIKGVAAQSVKPAKWVIVDDGSDDRGAEIVSRYIGQLDFLALVRLQREGGRTFGSKALAFNAGVRSLGRMPYSFIGNLDADIVLEPDYFRNILGMFAADPKLGLSGGMVFTKGENGYYSDDGTLDSVGGAVQLFRRECFDAVGGYLPLPYGGIDAAAEIMARMHGWSVRKSPSDRVWEQRRTGSAGAGPLTAAYRLGVRFHTLGYGNLFFLLRCAYRAGDKPFLLGSLGMLLGFVSARIRGIPVALPPEVVAYLRSEQRGKLKGGVSPLFRRGTSGKTDRPAVALSSDAERQTGH